MRTNTALTLYSKSIVDGDEVWTRSEVSAVQWEDADIAMNSPRIGSAGVFEADNVRVFIQFKIAPNLELNPGDYMVRGIVDDEIGSGEGETASITALRKKYDDVVVIRSVKRHDYGSYEMQHWEVGAN